MIQFSGDAQERLTIPVEGAPEFNHIYTGDCIEVMKTWPENFIDTIITDPPYGLDFMGKDWDGDVPGVHFWAEMIRICKPGSTLLAFGGTRTWHHLAMAIEKAGWQIRDCLMWLYGSGFPKSLDISKAMDKSQREVIGTIEAPGMAKQNVAQGAQKRSTTTFKKYGGPVSDMAKFWSGWGTALKPAWEPIIVAMKPTDGTFAENAEKWRVAGINVDGGRIGTKPRTTHKDGNFRTNAGGYDKGRDSMPLGEYPSATGRWPANLLLDEEAAAMLDGQSGMRSSGDLTGQPRTENKIYGSAANTLGVPRFHNGDSGGASRFFYVAKADRAERNEGCDAFDENPLNWSSGSQNPGAFQAEGTKRAAKNFHPTVKPLSLMKYLCNLTRTPAGGIVLDPFAGSGTTLWAAEFHNRPWIGIEMNPEYVAIANARIARERAQLKMAI